MIDRTGETCSACGEGSLISMVEERSWLEKGILVRSNVHYSLCTVCDSEIAGYGESRKNLENANRARLAVGLVPKEVIPKL